MLLICCQGKTSEPIRKRGCLCVNIHSKWSNSLILQGKDIAIGMAARYLFKVELRRKQILFFFVNLLNVIDYSLIKLTNDIKEHVQAVQVATPNTI